MKKEVALKWIEALRSGKYRQGRRFLCYDGKYCCLGVLNELYLNLELDKYDYTVGKSHETLPRANIIGLNSHTGYLPGSETSLAKLNDEGYTFDEIADIIQIEYVEGL